MTFRNKFLGALAAVAVLAFSAAPALAQYVSPKTVSVSDVDAEADFTTVVGSASVQNVGANRIFVRPGTSAATTTTGVALDPCMGAVFNFGTTGQPTELHIIASTGLTSTALVSGFYPQSNLGRTESVQFFTLGANCSLTASPTYTGNVTTAAQFVVTPTAQTVASDGAGTAAAFNIAATVGKVYVTCNDTDGCAGTLLETSAVSGASLVIVNVSANAVTLADTAGVSETVGALSLGQWDSVHYDYVVDRWVQAGAVVNN